MTQRLFIVWSHPLFRDAVLRLLNDPSIELVGTAFEFVTAVSKLEKLHPDVVIVEETEDSAVESIQALEILRICNWGPRVIRLSMQDNELWVYHHERRNINSGEDLINLVRDA